MNRIATKRPQGLKSRRIGQKSPDTSFGDWLAELGIEITHGDYQRIASLTRKHDGSPYTADYVRKVLLSLRNSPYILKTAKRYFKQMAKLQKVMATA